MQRLITITLLAFSSASATDLTGKWMARWEFVRADGVRRSGSTPLVFKQDGEKLSGHTYSKDGDPVTLREGKIKGELVTFEVADVYIPVKFELRVTGEKLVGKAIRVREDRKEEMSVTCERVPEK